MHKYYPLLIVGAIIGLFSIAFLIAYARIRNQKEAIGFERHISDGEIIRRLTAYAKPYAKTFLLIFLLMLFSIAYDIVAPLLVGRIAELIKDRFAMTLLFRMVAIYAGTLAVSLVCTYYQAMLLQKVGQKILSSLREDIFTHIESLPTISSARSPSASWSLVPPTTPTPSPCCLPTSL